MPARPRVLVIAEAANPEWVSVPLIGWSLASALGEVADVHIVTQVRNREALLRRGLVEGRDFTAIDSEAVAGPLWKVATALRMGEGKGWTTVQALSALSYPHFERLAWRRFGAQIRQGAFDVVHRITPLSPTIASPIAVKCAKAGVPFVLGPLNGGVPWPPGFDAERRRERELLSYVRGLYKLMPGRRRSLASCAAILAGSLHTRGELPAQLAGRCVYLPENAVDMARFSLAATHDGQILRACFIGRMVPYKGPDMLLEAARPLLASGRMRLAMIGDGPLRPQLERWVDDAGLRGAVTFHGWMAHADVQTAAADCSLFAFPSIREFGGGAVLEAMALGLAPLIVDYAGPGELVTARTGFKVPLGRRDEIVARFREELDRLAGNPDEVRAAGERARVRVLEHFTWQRKADQILQVYRWVLGQAEKPVFFPLHP